MWWLAAPPMFDRPRCALSSSESNLTRALLPFRGGYRATKCRYCCRSLWVTEEDTTEPAKACKDCTGYEALEIRCGICLEPSFPIAKTSCALPRTGKQPHIFCESCVGKYVSVKVEEGCAEVGCPHPGCEVNFNPKFLNQLICRGSLPAKVVDRLKDLKVERHLQHFRAVLSGGDPLFLSWVVENAQSCPGCFSIVQKGEGCDHVTCKCGTEFCFTCGDVWGCKTEACKKEPSPRTFNWRGIKPPTPARPPALLIAAQPPPPAVELSLPPVSSADEATPRILEMLTLKCPRCTKGFAMDEAFSECFALQCNSCPARFCSWCLADCNSNGEDPHSHVMDCTEAPEDMRGHALYLQDHNGGPHVAPRPHVKFTEHWRAKHGRIATSMLRTLDAAEAQTVLSKLPAEICTLCEC